MRANGVPQVGAGPRYSSSVRLGMRLHIAIVARNTEWTLKREIFHISREGQGYDLHNYFRHPTFYIDITYWQCHDCTCSMHYYLINQ